MNAPMNARLSGQQIIATFQEAVRQLRAADELDDDPTQPPLPFAEAFSIRMLLAYRQLGIPEPFQVVLDEKRSNKNDGPFWKVRVVTPKGSESHVLQWRSGWKTWASLDERREFRTNLASEILAGITAGNAVIQQTLETLQEAIARLKESAESGDDPASRPFPFDADLWKRLCRDYERSGYSTLVSYEPFSDSPEDGPKQQISVALWPFRHRQDGTIKHNFSWPSAWNECTSSNDRLSLTEHFGELLERALARLEHGS